MLLKKNWVLVFGFYVFGFSRCKGKIISYQSGIIVSHEAHSDRLLLESFGACLTKISIASSSYSSLCCGESSSRDSNLMKALDVVPKALLV